MAGKLRHIAVGNNTYDLQGGNLRIFYGTCSTAATTQTKVVSIAEVSELETGDVFYIKMTNAQTYNGVPKLQINSLAAKNITRTGSVNAARYEWNAGEILEFLYDGTSMVLVDGAIANTTYYGLTKLSSAVNSSSEETAATSKAVKTAYDAANKTMTGATATAAGASGNVPQPAAGDQGKFLRGDGTWGEGSGTVDSVNNVRPDISKNVTLTGSDINVSSTDSTTIASALDSQSEKVDAITVGSIVDASSLDLLKTNLINIARSMYAENSYSKLLRWLCNFTGTEFMYSVMYAGYLKITAAGSDYIYFVWNASSNIGDVVTMAYNNGEWHISNISSSIDNLKNTDNALESGLAIVANGNTHAAITSGQYVYVKNHSTLAEGMYTASTAIAANETLTTSNLTAINAGGLNALNSKCTLKKVTETFTSNNYSWIYFPENRTIISARLENKVSFIVTSIENMIQLTRGYYEQDMTYHQFSSNTQYKITYFYYDRS